MGALDKRIFSGVAIVSALLFIVSAAMLFASGAGLTDENSTAMYVMTVAGLFTLIYSVSMFLKDTSFVRKLTGVLLLITGILFMAVAFAGDSADTVLAVAGVLAGIALIADMLALWVSRIYGAMYVSAILAAANLVTGAMCLVNGYSDVYVLIMLIAFAVWLVISAWVSGFVSVETVTKTREVVEDTMAQKREKPQAKNKKATPKAKKAEAPKTETPEPEAPKEEPKAEQPAEPRKVRTVELPKTAAAQAAIQKSQEATKAEAPKEEPKAEQKPPAKAMGDFMQKLMSSEAASKAVKREAPAEPVKPAEPAPVAPKEEPAPEVPVEEPKAEEVPEEVPEQQPKTEAPEPETRVMEMEEPEVLEESVIAAPVEPKAESDLFHTEEPNWGVVARDSSAEEQPMCLKSSKDVADAPREEPAPEVPVEEPKAEEVPEEVPEQQPKTEAPEPETRVMEMEGSPSEEAAEPAPEAPVEEPKAEETPSEPVPSDDTPAVDVAPEVAESVISAPVETPAEPEPAEPAAEPNWDMVARDTSEPEPAPESPAEQQPEDVPTEDIYTDNSPEALVRRAAWNKGLRCRRGYGERNIPVAFVKGKVAVYVDEGEPDTSGDDDLRAEGWTVLRYRAEDITDGKAQGDEIAVAVKENTKSTSKKKSKR